MVSSAWPNTSTATLEDSHPFLTYSPIELDRARIFGSPPSPRTIAETRVDLPVPLGPIITFRYSDGWKTHSLYVLQKENNYFVNLHNKEFRKLEGKGSYLELLIQNIE